MGHMFVRNLISQARLPVALFGCALFLGSAIAPSLFAHPGHGPEELAADPTLSHLSFHAAQLLLTWEVWAFIAAIFATIFSATRWNRWLTKPLITRA